MRILIFGCEIQEWFLLKFSLQTPLHDLRSPVLAKKSTDNVAGSTDRFNPTIVSLHLLRSLPSSHPSILDRSVIPGPTLLQLYSFVMRIVDFSICRIAQPSYG